MFISASLQSSARTKSVTDRSLIAHYSLTMQAKTDNFQPLREAERGVSGKTNRTLPRIGMYIYKYNMVLSNHQTPHVWLLPLCRAQLILIHPPTHSFYPWLNAQSTNPHSSNASHNLQPCSLFSPYD